MERRQPEIAELTDCQPREDRHRQVSGPERRRREAPEDTRAELSRHPMAEDDRCCTQEDVERSRDKQAVRRHEEPRHQNEQWIADVVPGPVAHLVDDPPRRPAD